MIPRHHSGRSIFYASQSSEKIGDDHLSGPSIALGLERALSDHKGRSTTLAPGKDFAVAPPMFPSELSDALSGSESLGFRLGTSLFAPLSLQTTAVSRYLFIQPHFCNRRFDHLDQKLASHDLVICIQCRSGAGECPDFPLLVPRSAHHPEVNGRTSRIKKIHS